MRRFSLLALLSLSAAAQTPRPFRVVRLDAALDAIVDTKAQIETLGEHFGLTEGPLWIADASVTPGGGYLLFSDCAANVIYKWQQGKPLSVFLEKSGYTGNDVNNVGTQTVSGRLAILLVGSNGLALDPEGRIIITAMTDRTLVRLEKDGKRTILADRYEGKRFGGPNDLTVARNGAIYFADTIFGMRGGETSPARELPYSGLYLVKDGRVTLLDSDRDRPGEYPNGVTLSPDEKTLYVTGGRGKVYAYDVAPDNTISNRRLFVAAGNDGMKTDTQGNLFLVNPAGTGEVWIVSPAGKHLGTLELPEVPGEPRPRICATNVAFGDPDGRGLYITSCTHVFKVRLKAGRR